jgi:endonuclease/exonuclease/phosphatase family metal-dependent hydrolase
MGLVVDGIRALDPDVVALQEVREVPNQLPNQARALATALGYHPVFEPATPFAGGYEGLAFLCKTPIHEHRAVELPHAEPNERRIVLSVCVGLPKIWIHTTHLNYRLTHGKQREDQVCFIANRISEIASDHPQVLCGDLNARPESDEIRYLRGLVTLENRRVYFQDAWARLHPDDPGFTWATSNPNTKILEFLEPDRRLDYIFVTPMRRDGRGRIHRCQIVLDKPNSQGVYPSDHYGLLAEIQLEPG